MERHISTTPLILSARVGVLAMISEVKGWIAMMDTPQETGH